MSRSIVCVACKWNLSVLMHIFLMQHLPKTRTKNYPLVSRHLNRHADNGVINANNWLTSILPSSSNPASPKHEQAAEAMPPPGTPTNSILFLFPPHHWFGEDTFFHSKYSIPKFWLSEFKGPWLMASDTIKKNWYKPWLPCRNHTSLQWTLIVKR